MCVDPIDQLLVLQERIKNVLKTCESHQSSWKCKENTHSITEAQEFPPLKHLLPRPEMTELIYTTSTRLDPLQPSARQMCRPQQIPARSSSIGSSLRTCLPCHAREKERRHHFDCSSQPQHCRSIVCQAHSLLVSKISHSGQGNCRAEHNHTHTHIHSC